MLGIHYSISPEAGSSYFSNNLSHEGEYYMDKKIESFWYGNLAARLGLFKNKVTKHDFISLVKALDPKTKKSLRVRQVKNARSYIDLTFSVPKSVSVAYGISKKDDFLTAHQQAYQAVMRELEKSVQTQANDLLERHWEETGELIYAPFDHFLSRSSEIKKGNDISYQACPQMHTHVIVPCITYSHVNDRFQAIELYNVHAQAKYWESSYHAHLAANLERMGYKTIKTKDRFELYGLHDRSLLERFSNRSKTILETAQKKGIVHNKAEVAKLAVKTRHSKAKDLDEKELYHHWLERLTPGELNTINNLKSVASPDQKHLNPDKAIQHALDHLCERNSAFKRSDVLAYAMKINYGAPFLPNDYSNALDQRKDIIQAELNTVPYVATHDTLAQEQKLVLECVAGKNTLTPVNPHFKPTVSYLNEEQEKALSILLTSRDFLVGISGVSGSGKSTLLEQLRFAHFETGKKLIALSPTSNQAELLKDKGFSEATTIAGFLKNTRLHQHLYGKSLVVDEFGMVGTKQANEIIAVAKQYKARLFLVGDTAQHAPPAQYGDAMKHLISKAKMRTAQVSTIIRQQSNEQYRQAVELLSKHRTLEGFKKLDKMGVVHEQEDAEIRLKNIAEKYVSALKSKKSVCVVAPTHAEINQINDNIRDALKNEGIIKKKEKSFLSLRSLSLTNDEKQRQTNYEPGMHVRFSNNLSGNYRAGTNYEVIQGKTPHDLQLKNTKSGSLHQIPFHHHQHMEIYSASNLPLAINDRIRLSANSHSVEGGKVTNGTVYTVKGFTRNGDIKVGKNKTLKKDTGTIRYAMCDTSHGSQGKDVDVAIVSVSDTSFTTASREQFYVSVSRGKTAVSIHTSNKAELQKAIAKSEQRISAQDIADKQKQQILTRNQRQHYSSLIKEQTKYHEQQRNRPSITPKHLPHQQNINGREK